MTTLTECDAPANDRPTLRAVVRRLGVSLLVACAVPATVFYACLRLEGVWVAIFAALTWSYGAIAWRALTGRRTSGLLILTAVVMTGRTLIALLTDSTYLYFLQPIISDGLIGVTFLATLATARPMVARLAGDFYPMDEELHGRPAIRRLFRYLTLGWALLCLGKATMTLWLLQSQSLETFVLVKSVSVLLLNGLAVAATVGAAALVARREGLLGDQLVPVPVPVPVSG
ncbi:VC0807 family protein [Nocardioides sp.]|uniref:VC0807 family protein n=1 Tax=Nocardioides sp. TaxID=35761 RepID=UPI0026271146|nr:VC0807 family protein [Nocardioides sp.]MDI6908698.1 VC0807 family protein [Nocardioides sp.]